MEKDKLIIYDNGYFNIVPELKNRSFNLRKNWEENVLEAREALCKIRETIHLPHCLDYEWWFADNTHEFLIEKLITKSQMPIPQNLTFLGSPLFRSFLCFYF